MKKKENFMVKPCKIDELIQRNANLKKSKSITIGMASGKVKTPDLYSVQEAKVILQSVI